MSLVDFDTWWNEFWAEQRVRDGGYDAVGQLARYVSTLSEELCTKFVAHLAEVAGGPAEWWGAAPAVLEEHNTPSVLSRIASYLRDLPTTDDNYGAYLRVLASGTSPEHLRMLESFLLEGEIQPLGDARCPEMCSGRSRRRSGAIMAQAASRSLGGTRLSLA